MAVDPNLAKSRLNTIAEEIIALLTNEPDAEVRVTLEIDAEFPGGADEATRRGVSENANSLGFQLKEWE